MSQQDFAVIYKSHTYYVDPTKLSNSSKAFQNLIQPYLDQPNEMRKINLKIQTEKFSDRNINNFLKLCQNIPTDCYNSEIKEICEIAKMFQADQIYDTGVNFVRSSIDANFSVSDQEYNNQYLTISPVVKKPHHFSDINSLEFEDDENLDQVSNQENMNPNIVNEPEKVPVAQTEHNAVYRIKIVQQLMKSPILQFLANGKAIYSAKHKYNEIVIGRGSSVHLNKNRSSHVGQIIMENGGVNIVFCDNQQFKVKYIYLPGPETFSIEATFLNKGTQLHWKPKHPKFNNITNTYSLSLHGEYNHVPMKSIKNTVLVNDDDKMVFIARQINGFEFEVECNPSVSCLNVFALALSQILGPSDEYSKMIRK